MASPGLSVSFAPSVVCVDGGTLCSLSKTPEGLCLALLLVQVDVLLGVGIHEVEREVATRTAVVSGAHLRHEAFHSRMLEVRKVNVHPGKVLGVAQEAGVLLQWREVSKLLRVVENLDQEVDRLMDIAALILQVEDVITLTLNDLHVGDQVIERVILIVGGTPPTTHFQW